MAASLNGEKRKKFWSRQRKLECAYCGKRVYREVNNTHNSKATIDHIVPLSKGGTNAQYNLVLSCFECNNRKGSKEVDKFVTNNRIMGLIEILRAL